MTLSRKRKNTTGSSRSAFRIRPSKRLAATASQTTSNTASHNLDCQCDGANSSSDPGSHPIPALVIGVRARFKKSGSKILSILSWRSSSTSSGKIDDSSSVHQREREEAISIARDAASCATSSPEYLAPIGSEQLPTPPLSPISEDYAVIPFRDLPLALEQPRRVSDSTKLQIKVDVMRAHPKAPKEAFHERSSSLRKSQSMPGLSHRLSHKLSSTFGNPTIVHRSSLRSRPSIQSVNHTSAGLKLQGDNAQDSTDPSTNSGSGSSPRGPSTAPTSLPSDGSMPSPKRKGNSDRTPLLEKSKSLSAISSLNRQTKEKKLTPIEEMPPLVMPSVVTVETTATAKIFFETHFNSILSSNHTPRSLRRRELEEKLAAEPMSSLQRQNMRQAWLRQESEYIRQTRVLKTRTNGAKGGQRVAIAGYEVIKVLGKGSFGVVRLVKEKARNPEATSGESSTATHFQKQTTKSEFSQLRSATFEALKSSVPGTKASRRKDLNKMKKEVYAMKVIRKSDMLRNTQEGHLRAERDFLIASEKSRWVVPLIASFQDAKNLYLVMDYMVGGDFLGLLIRKTTLSEDVSRWYIAEMILCVEEAHKLRWIHRDVKPDNFLISASGHLKISDFGLAFDGHWAHDQSYYNNHRHSLLGKLGIQVDGDAADQEEARNAEGNRQLANIFTGSTNPINSPPNSDEIPTPKEGILQWRNRKQKRKLAKSVVGTSQYMAPEIIRGDLYDGRCDWWSIGIILYECLYGYTPFACDNRQDTKLKILQHPKSLRFPAERTSDKLVSSKAIDLMNSLLQEREHRLSSKKYLLNDYLHSRQPGHLIPTPADRHSKNYQGYFVYADDAEEIKTHSFFRGVQWNQMHTMKPPFVPKVKNWEDTKYFEEDEPISDVDDASTISSVHSTKDGDTSKGKGKGPEGISPVSPLSPSTFENAITAAGIPTSEPLGIESFKGKSVNEIIAEQNKRLKFAEEMRERAEKEKEKAEKKKQKEKKRPRDKMLRDKEVGRQVLELRKKGAFLGYTYRRPKGLESLWTASVNGKGENERTG